MARMCSHIVRPGFRHLALSAGLTLLGLTVIVPYAYADGWVFWGIGRDVYMPSQKAVIVFDEGVEDLILSVQLMGQGEDAAWVVAVPSRPDVRTATAPLFFYLSDITQPRTEWEDVYIFGPTPTATITPGAPKVELLERKKVGIYDVSVLAADDPRALVKWLNENGYHFPKEGEGIVDRYAREGWFFVAMRVAPGAEHHYVEGDVQPLWLSFPTIEPVYPMRLTALSPSEVEVLLYILADHRMEIEGFEVEYAGFQELEPPKPETDPSLFKLLTRQPYFVTKLRRRNFSPKEMTEDLYPRQAANDNPYQEVIRRRRYIPVTPTVTLTNTASPTPKPIQATLTPTATRPIVLEGDGNGDGRCTEVDALMALKMAVGLQTPDIARIDVNSDGQVTEVDALQILKWAVAGGQCGAGVIAPTPVVTPTMVLTVSPIVTATVPVSPTSTSTPTPTSTAEPVGGTVSITATSTEPRVGEVITVTVTLHNRGPVMVGQPQFSLLCEYEDDLPILEPARAEPVVHRIPVNQGETDTAEFAFQAVRPGMVTLKASVNFEFQVGPQVGYQGIPFWQWGTVSSEEALEIRVAALSTDLGFSDELIARLEAEGYHLDESYEITWLAPK